METQGIARRLVELCRKADFAAAQNELFAEDAASIEPDGSPWETVHGIDALNAKIEKWNQMVEEVHKVEVSDPVIAGNFFTVKMAFDITVQGGERNYAEEIVVYEVKDGKVVLEQFFYSF